VSRFLAINIEGKIGQLTVRRTSSFINRQNQSITGNKGKYMAINRNVGLKNKQYLHRNEFTFFFAMNNITY
jgi:hypothetical protein